MGLLHTRTGRRKCSNPGCIVGSQISLPNRCGHASRKQLCSGAQVEYHYFPDSAISRPPVMLGVLQGLRRRGLRAFSVEPNIWGASSGHDFMEYAYIQARPAWQMSHRRVRPWALPADLPGHSSGTQQQLKR